MSEVDRLRRDQSHRVMPLIGPLVDQWEGLTNDSKSTLRWGAPALCEYLDRIAAAVSVHADEPLLSEDRSDAHCRGPEDCTLVGTCAQCFDKKDRPDPDLDRTLSAVNDAMNEPKGD